MKHTYKPCGVCSSRMTIDLDGDIIRRVVIDDGCDGNSSGLVRLLEGRSAAEAAELLAGIKCGRKASSCPDQLAIAIRQALDQQ